MSRLDATAEGKACYMQGYIPSPGLKRGNLWYRPGLPPRGIRNFCVCGAPTAGNWWEITLSLPKKCVLLVPFPSKNGLKERLIKLINNTQFWGFCSAWQCRKSQNSCRTPHDVQQASGKRFGKDAIRCPTGKWETLWQGRHTMSNRQVGNALPRIS